MVVGRHIAQGMAYVCIEFSICCLVPGTGRISNLYYLSSQIGFKCVQLMLLKRGGQVIYAGPLGHHSHKLIEYFQVGRVSSLLSSPRELQEVYLQACLLVVLSILFKTPLSGRVSVAGHSGSRENGGRHQPGDLDAGSQLYFARSSTGCGFC